MPFPHGVPVAPLRNFLQPGFGLDGSLLGLAQASFFLRIKRFWLTSWLLASFPCRALPLLGLLALSPRNELLGPAERPVYFDCFVRLRRLEPLGKAAAVGLER